MEVPHEMDYACPYKRPAPNERSSGSCCYVEPTPVHGKYATVPWAPRRVRHNLYHALQSRIAMNAIVVQKLQLNTS